MVKDMQKYVLLISFYIIPRHTAEGLDVLKRFVGEEFEGGLVVDMDCNGTHVK